MTDAAKIAVMKAALEQAEDYFDNKADVRDGSYGEPAPNIEMQLLAEVRVALRMACSEQSQAV